MCNTLEQDVKEFVKQKIAKGESFTAFDVTTELGAAKHRYIKPIVHAMFDDGEMGVVARTIDYTIDGQPFRYTPAPVVASTPQDENDPNHPDYCMDCRGKCEFNQPTRNPANAVNTTPAPVVRIGVDATTQSSAVGDEASANEGGTRLRIRKGTLDKAGFAYGSQVYAVALGDKIMLSTQKPLNSGVKMVQAEVDNRRNVRINLSKLGVDVGVNGAQFRAIPQDGLVVVEVI